MHAIFLAVIRVLDFTVWSFAISEMGENYP